MHFIELHWVLNDMIEVIVSLGFFPVHSKSRLLFHFLLVRVGTDDSQKNNETNITIRKASISIFTI